VGNKIRSQKDKDFLLNKMDDFHFLGFLPFTDTIIQADLDDKPPYVLNPDGLKIVSQMIQENFE